MPDALGIAAYAIAMETLSLLEKRGVISREDGQEVLDAALSGVERTSGGGDEATLARKMLERQLELWVKDRPQRDI